MTNLFTRSLRVFLNSPNSADYIEIGAGCPMALTGKERMTLRPSFFELTIENLSSSSAALLSTFPQIGVICGSSVLASGEVSEVVTRSEDGRPVTHIGFAFGLSLWRSSVSLTVDAGKTVSETARLLLSASGSNLPLTCFTGENRTFSRPQSFFGRTADALTELARSAGAKPCYSPGGVAVIGNTAAAPSLIIRESDLISAPKAVLSGTILKTAPIGLPMGTVIQAAWKDETLIGRLISRSLDCRTVSGPWQCELLLEPLK